LGASPHPPQRKQLFNLLGDVPQILLDTRQAIGSGHTIPYHTIPDQLQKQDDYVILNTTGHGGPPQKRRWELRVLVGELRLHAASVKPDYGMLR